ncbi:lysozyme inhibitor LprI family protein [Dyella sp.]|uniref:lysozyme inhibitor LprI family protein n=1 Tax=Dyella sp. TaxID=1869338 RepID=UPI002ED34F62
MKAPLGGLLVLLGLVSMPAVAMDCAKASTKMEKRICGDKKLTAVDNAMSAAYFKLLRQVKDADIRASLINSQRRWIVAREHDLSDLSAGDGEGLDEAQQRAVVLAVTRARISDLQEVSGGQPRFVADALKQRAAAAAYSGGPFAGYHGSCSFIPDRQDPTKYSYNCFGSHAYQNNHRVCAESADFASYSEETVRAVADVDGVKLKPIATCALGTSTDSECPDSYSDQKSHWNTHPTDAQFNAAFGSGDVLKLDPELSVADDDGEQGWIHACLTDTRFPLGHAGQ